MHKALHLRDDIDSKRKEKEFSPALRIRVEAST